MLVYQRVPPQIACPSPLSSCLWYSNGPMHAHATCDCVVNSYPGIAGCNMVQSHDHKDHKGPIGHFGIVAVLS